MQTSAPLQRYDRSLIVPHLSPSEIDYRRSYGLPMHPDEALKLMMKSCNKKVKNFNVELAKEIVYHEMQKNIISDDVEYIGLVKNKNDSIKLLQVKAYRISEPVEIPLDLILIMAQEHPYLGLCAGYFLDFIIDQFSIGAYTDVSGCSLEDVKYMIEEAGEDVPGLLANATEEDALFKRLQRLMKWCSNNFYNDYEFRDHPFFVMVKDAIKEMEHCELETYFSIKDAKKSLSKEEMYAFVDRDEDVYCNLSLGITYLLSNSKVFSGVENFQQIGTSHIMEADEFCGLIVNAERYKLISESFEVLKKYELRIYREFYNNKPDVLWNKLSSLKNILSFTKMDTLKGGTLLNKKAKASSGRRTLLELLS